MQDLRKVQETNKRTLIISLPKRWGSAFPVVAGDHLQLELQSDGSVLMRRHGGAGAVPTRLDAHGLGVEEARRKAVHLFLMGLPGASFCGLDAWPRSAIGELKAGLRDLLGAEVVDEGPDVLEVLFLGADRAEHAAIAGRRLASLACDVFAGTRPDMAEVSRYRLLVLRLLARAARDPAHGLDVELGARVLQLASIASFAAAVARHGPPASEPVLAHFRAAADAILGRSPFPTGPPQPANLRDEVALAAADALRHG